MEGGADQDNVLLGLVGSPGPLIEELAEAMYDVQAMSDPRSRQQVLRLVTRQNRAFTPDRSSSDNQEIKNFIIACSADDESFDLLLDAIRTYSPRDDPDFSTLEMVVKTRLPRAALTKGELSELLALEPDTIAQAQQLAAGMQRARPPDFGRGGRDNPGSVREAALSLLDAGSPQEGLCRLLRFVDWLAQMALLTCHPPDPSLAGRLRDWINRVGGAHNLSPAAWLTSAGPVLGGDPVLLIELEPVADRFAVYLWLWVPGYGPRTLDWDEDPFRLDELRVRLDELLDLASDELGEIQGKPQVEFLLDLEILNQDVDWWLFGAARGGARPLGAEYKVAVRRRRARGQERRNWQARWQALMQAQAVTPLSDLVVWVRDGSTSSPEDLWAQLRDDTKILVAPLGTCEKLDDEMRNLLLLAFTQGMPVALCVRRAPADAAAHLECLEAALAHAHLAELPELVRAWREKAYLARGDGFGHDLVLLWDNYDRRLPDTRGTLASPAVKGARQ